MAEATPREAALAERERARLLVRDPRRSPYAVVGRFDVPPGGEALIDALEPAVRVAERGGVFKIDGKLEALPGAFIERGRYVLKLSHQNFPAVLVLDTESPRVREGPPPRWFDYDERLRVPARLQRDAEPREVIVQSTLGLRRRALRLGFLEAEVAGARARLLALRLLEPGVEEAALSIFFRDETCGALSYGVGRYLDPEPSAADDRYTLDFNRAYNPLCAFSPHFNCPIPPRENLLSVKILAGEQDPDPAAHSA